MAYEDLKDHDIFLPEEAWGKVDLSSSVNELALTLVYILGIASCVLMAVGGGHMLTWIGVICFLVFMVLFTLVSNAGIENQNEVINEMERKYEYQSRDGDSEAYGSDEEEAKKEEQPEENPET